ncbi:uncharacterized protein LOC111705328 [Eurytemora carolleeae]|uniref:uncharacterized protein LOC111705328 n=1 Tax=Eurytemora carolleeae TaxID=1294199 RepID=UPI000C76CCFF|nr:uncharacterized protein LOC111705328 [Eurytemora carolleeae]|eukprot:XP_023333595.1 uncharacterized protein LOC111705328 [Eurytemora affinis]
MNIIRPIIEYNRSISENEGVEQRAKEERALKVKNERRMSNRQKLLAMKRYSGYLKRPEILETVYSVEEDCTEAGKPGEVSAENSQEQEAEPEQEQEQEQEQKEETRGGLRKFRIDSDITDYDYSTDSESLRFFFSETDPSGCNTGCNTSELCSRRSSCGSQPNLLDVGKDGTEDSSKSRSMEDLRGKLKQQPHPLPEMKAIDRRRRMFQQHTSVSLDCNDK